MKIVRESISFERGSTDKAIKRRIRGNRLIPGEIVVRDFPAVNSHVKYLAIFTKDYPDTSLADIEAYSFGTIDRMTKKVCFIHDRTNKTGKSGLHKNGWRFPTEDERESIQVALDSGKYDEYIEEAKKKTGLTPFV